jgi:hypothetical protein
MGAKVPLLNFKVSIADGFCCVIDGVDDVLARDVFNSVVAQMAETGVLSSAPG